MAGSVLFTVLLWPESNYLPPVKRDTVDSFLFFPPGTNIETADREIAQLLIERLEPHLSGEKEPAIRDYFLWSFPGGSGGWLAINPKSCQASPTCSVSRCGAACSAVSRVRTASRCGLPLSTSTD
jgi:hypothetical protein